MGVPRFQQSLEQSRADVAGANLRSIWSAQRLYWLENRTFAPDLPTLYSANLIDPSLPTATAPYTYPMTVASDGSSFTATATRTGTSSWSGSFTIAADGSFSGSIQQSGGPPSYRDSNETPHRDPTERRGWSGDRRVADPARPYAPGGPDRLRAVGDRPDRPLPARRHAAPAGPGAGKTPPGTGRAVQLDRQHRPDDARGPDLLPCALAEPAGAEAAGAQISTSTRSPAIRAR